MEKTYTVEGLSEYVTDFSAIPQEFLDSLKKEAEDAIYAYTAKAYGSNFTLSELTYSGYVLNTVKSAKDFSGNFNDLALIFSGTVSGKDEELPSMVVYYPIRYTSILNTAGEMSYEDMEACFNICFKATFPIPFDSISCNKYCSIINHTSQLLNSYNLINLIFSFSDCENIYFLSFRICS